MPGANFLVKMGHKLSKLFIYDVINQSKIAFFLKNMKYRKSLTSILRVKEAENRQSGISSFDSLDIELSFRAIRF